MSDRGRRGGPYKRGLEKGLLDSTPFSHPHIDTLGTNPSEYGGHKVTFMSPIEVGCFSLDEEGHYLGDNSRLRDLKAPAGMDSGKASLRWDVMTGFKRPVVSFNSEENVGLNNILTWMKENRRLLASSGKPVDYDFVTRRGLLTKIMCTPYKTKEEWNLTVTLFKGTLYMNEMESTEKYKNLSEMDKMLSEAGYKFEFYMCEGPDSVNGLNVNEAFFSVLKGKIDSNSFLVSGEVDCKDPSSTKTAPACYVELKTRVHDQRLSSYKLLNWWCQSFLLGIPLIIAGSRDQRGKIVSLEKYETSKIPELVKNEKPPWKPDVCLNFCNAFLSYVKRVATIDDPKVVYVFSRKPDQNITYTVIRNGSQVIPDWYVKEL